MTLSPLPIDKWLPRIGEELRASPTLLLEAEPGAGKTTRVPPWLAGLGRPGTSGGEVWVLEPRRVAARAAARRVADEVGSSVGDEVGYQVRFERRVSPATRVRFVGMPSAASMVYEMAYQYDPGGRRMEWVTAGEADRDLAPSSALADAAESAPM